MHASFSNFVQWSHIWIFFLHFQLNSNWFPPPEASLKRSHIQNLIHDIFENNSSQAPPVDCHGKDPLPEIPSVIKHRVEADSPGDCCYPAMWHGNPSNLSTDIHFPTASPIRVASCLKEPGFVFKDLQTEVVSSHSDCLQMPACHQKGFLSPIEVFKSLHWLITVIIS